MAIKIALAGNPNSGKTTLFNGLTGSNQFVGNWPGVTVEKKEGSLKGRKDVRIVDLPGIYSLSPYSLEEVIAREYLANERPDAILNIIDGTNLERNLYLTTQLLELGIPMVAAINMMDIVEKNGDKIGILELSKQLGCPVVEISAVKGKGITEAANAAITAFEKKEKKTSYLKFSAKVEEVLSAIENEMPLSLQAERKRYFSIKLFEKDKKAVEKLGLQENTKKKIDEIIELYKKNSEDDTESIIVSERYSLIADMLKGCYKKQNRGKLTVSDKIDRVLTNRLFALPIFAVAMIFVYVISVTTVGKWATDWANEGVFGDGWHLTGAGAFEEAGSDYQKQQTIKEGYIEAAEAEGIDTSDIKAALEEEELSSGVVNAFIERAGNIETAIEIKNEDGGVEETLTVNAEDFKTALEAEEPVPSDFGIWVPGVPAMLETLLDKIHVAEWLKSLILDGIVGGVGAVLGFVPQLLILFIFLAFLEACGYMARVAFIMDRMFRKFGLSGKSFIPMLIATGCGIPGVMASRTIESQKDRRMTIMTATFMPCTAKLPIIALISGALFNGAWWVAPSAYFLGIFAIVTSGIILKKTKPFEGEPAPFIMELPAYHMPTISNILRSMWERGWSFIKKAGSIILISSIIIWTLSRLGWAEESFGFLAEDQLEYSMLAFLGRSVAWLFMPLGWDDWKSAVATVTGLVAKENVVGTFGVLYNYAEVSEAGEEIWSTLASNYTTAAAYSFLVFNLLCAPCFAAIGAIKREMNNAKWTWFTIGYQTALAYTMSLIVYQFGALIVTGSFGVGTIAAIILLAGFLYLLFKPQKNLKKIQVKR